MGKILKSIPQKLEPTGLFLTDAERQYIAETLHKAGITVKICGEWDGTGYSRTCSKCGAKRDIKVQMYWSFCPNCGADMRGEKDG